MQALDHAIPSQRCGSAHNGHCPWHGLEIDFFAVFSEYADKMADWDAISVHLQIKICPETTRCMGNGNIAP